MVKKVKNKAIEYARVGNIEQLEYLVEENIMSREQDKVVGIYVRANTSESIKQQESMLEDYCAEHNLDNTIKYIDIGKNGIDTERKALQQLIRDIKDKRISTVLVQNISRLFRKPTDANKFLNEKYMSGMEVISIDNSVEKLKMVEMVLSECREENIEESIEK